MCRRGPKKPKMGLQAYLKLCKLTFYFKFKHTQMQLMAHNLNGPKYIKILKINTNRSVTKL